MQGVIAVDAAVGQNLQDVYGEVFAPANYPRADGSVGDARIHRKLPPRIAAQVAVVVTNRIAIGVEVVDLHVSTLMFVISDVKHRARAALIAQIRQIGRILAPGDAHAVIQLGAARQR